MIRAISILCMVYMVLVAGGTALRLLRADRQGRYMLLKNYNKGKFTLIYLSVLPLFLAGHLHNGKHVLDAVFSSFRNMLESVVLKFDFEAVEPLMDRSPIFAAAVIGAFILITVNTAMFFVILFSRQLQQFFRLLVIRRSNKPLLVLVGFNEQMQQVLSQADRKKTAVLVLAEADEKLIETAYLQKCAYLAFSDGQPLMQTLEKVRPRYHKRVVRVIIHTKDDITNLACATDAAETAQRLGMCVRSLDEQYGLKVFVFGSENSASAYIRLSEISAGCVQFINPQERVAMQFVDKYPLTSLLKPQDIDTETATVNELVHARMLFIGFGKTNRQLLQCYVRNNQVQTRREQDGKMMLDEKPVDYFVYDVAAAQEEKNLNHNSFRYKQWLATADASQCLPLPQDPFQVTFRRQNINSADFYQTIRADLTAPMSEQTADTEVGRNGIVVSLGSDLESLDVAEKLLEKLTEWDLDENTTIFVHIRDDRMSERVALRQCGEKMVVFGNEKKEIFHPQHILREQLALMARRRHISHTAEKYAQEDYQKACETALKKWCTEWTQVQRESNIYACLSLRLRLHLMGFDYLPQQAQGEDAREAFLAAYQKGDPIVYTDKQADGRAVADYSDINFKYDTVRAVLARTEHQRWNAYMISNGYVPANRKEILTLSRAQMFRARKHANLTTFEGLVEYRKMMAGPTCTEAQADVIRYDYQLMDDALWLLEKSGYKIVKRNVGGN